MNRNKLQRFLAIVLLVLPIGCQHNLPASSKAALGEIDWVCEAFLPIKWEEPILEETRLQIIEHNAVWNALCMGEA